MRRHIELVEEETLDFIAAVDTGRQTDGVDNRQAGLDALGSRPEVG
jgi:hypothetical protein